MSVSLCRSVGRRRISKIRTFRIKVTFVVGSYAWSPVYPGTPLSPPVSWTHGRTVLVWLRSVLESLTNFYRWRGWLIRHFSSIAVLVCYISDHLDAAIWQTHSVLAMGGVTFPLLLVAVSSPGIVVSHTVCEVVADMFL